MEHFTSRKAMNIDSLGSETIDMLYEKGFIKNIADIYDLNKYKAELIKIERMGEKSVNNLLTGIEESKGIPFERVLYALGIRHVGETLAKKLARQLRHIDAIIEEVSGQMLDGKTKLTDVKDIGEQVSDSLRKYFSERKNLELIARLKKHGFQFESKAEQQKQSTRLAGFIFVVSGVFTKFSRENLKDLIEQHGGKVAGTVSGKTSYVVAGENMGPEKLKKAEKLGVRVINEEEFEKMII